MPYRKVRDLDTSFKSYSQPIYNPKTDNSPKLVDIVPDLGRAERTHIGKAIKALKRADREGRFQSKGLSPFPRHGEPTVYWYLQNIRNVPSEDFDDEDMSNRETKIFNMRSYTKERLDDLVDEFAGEFQTQWTPAYDVEMRQSEQEPSILYRLRKEHSKLNPDGTEKIPFYLDESFPYNVQDVIERLRRKAIYNN